MIKPVAGSDLEEQLELARRNIEQWPQYLRIAFGFERAEDSAPQLPPTPPKEKWDLLDYF
jgi:hypothetical protein